MKYEKQVSLLIDLIPIISTDEDFALKGGTIYIPRGVEIVCEGSCTSSSTE